MLLDFEVLVQKYDLKITGILHCGAHLGEEARDYHRMGVDNVWWFEANPRVIPKLTREVTRYGQHVIQALLTDTDGDMVQFNVTNYDGMSSSIYEFGKLHLDSSPDTHFIERIDLETSTLDTLVAKYSITDCNMINADLQGAEYLALMGASRTLLNIDYIYCEVNRGYVYEGIHLVDELDKLLDDYQRVATAWTPAKWGDALYIRKDLL